MTVTVNRPLTPPPPSDPPAGAAGPPLPPPPDDVASPPPGNGDAGEGVLARLRRDVPVPEGTGRLVAVTASLGLAALALWSLIYVLLISSVQHSRVQHELYATMRSQLAQATAPIGGTIAIGTPVAVLDIPAAGLHGEVIVEGTTAGAMRMGPGHLRTSPLPGQPGLSIVYGRAVSFGAPFGRLPHLTPGATITAVTDQGRFRYVVRGLRHAKDPFVVPAAGTSVLTLVTSEGGWAPDRIVYVDATLQGKPATDPGGRPTALSEQEKLMANDAGTLTLVQLVLWLQLLLIVMCLLVWLRRRWGGWQLWLVAVPVVLATVWGLSNTTVRLLPNLL